MAHVSCTAAALKLGGRWVAAERCRDPVAALPQGDATHVNVRRLVFACAYGADSGPTCSARRDRAAGGREHHDSVLGLPGPEGERCQAGAKAIATSEACGAHGVLAQRLLSTPGAGGARSVTPRFPGTSSPEHPTRVQVEFPIADQPSSPVSPSVGEEASQMHRRRETQIRHPLGSLAAVVATCCAQMAYTLGGRLEGARRMPPIIVDLQIAATRQPYLIGGRTKMQQDRQRRLTTRALWRKRLPAHVDVRDASSSDRRRPTGFWLVALRSRDSCAMACHDGRNCHVGCPALRPVRPDDRRGPVSAAAMRLHRRIERLLVVAAPSRRNASLPASLLAWLDGLL